MPRGGARPNSGGRREGAGRKKGSGTTKTLKTNALAQQAAGEGALPLEVMLRAMRHHLSPGHLDLDKAAAFAKDAAPYVHPKLAAVQLTGKGGGPLEFASMTDADLDTRIAELERAVREGAGREGIGALPG
jgi:hypothetical protein